MIFFRGYLYIDNIQKQIMILQPFTDYSKQLQLHVISRQFELEEWGWLHRIANLM